MDQQGSSIVYLGGCQLSFDREQFGSRGIAFQMGQFRTIHGEYVCTRGDRSTRSDRSGRINLNTLYRKGDNIIWGTGYFVTPALKQPPPLECRAASEPAYRQLQRVVIAVKK